MFDEEFYPTTSETIADMVNLCGISVKGKVVYEPQAGKGDIVDWCKGNGAKDIIACELHPELRKIVEGKCKIIAHDSYTVTSDKISHVNIILMNPPFSSADKHIVHAFEIAPPGCQIVALCPVTMLKNVRIKTRIRLEELIKSHGYKMQLGACFQKGERRTNVDVFCIYLQKPGIVKDEFEGFFMDEDPEEQQANALMSYSVVRDIVNRYVAAVKLFDQQLQVGIQMSVLLQGMTPRHYSYIAKDKRDTGFIEFTASVNGAPLMRSDFKKSLQRRFWMVVFEKMNLEKYATKSLREQINKQVETQTDIPFTMKNVYHMLDMVIQTTGQRMDYALVEVFDRITSHSSDNQYRVEGWKTNSHFLLTKRFILPSHSRSEVLDDMIKALCFISGANYDKIPILENYLRDKNWLVDSNGEFVEEDCGSFKIIRSWQDYELDQYDTRKKVLKENPGCKFHRFEASKCWGKWFDWAFFKIRRYKKGTMHFEFKDENLLNRFNKEIARIKGYVLFEGKNQTEFQKRQTGRKKKAA